MRVRYTGTAARDLDESVEYLREHAPSLVGDFADSIETAVMELLDNPYSAQETEKGGVRGKYIRRFRYVLFYAVDVESDELVILHVRHTARRP
jgi:plasmid stabilization system protein ParE